MTDEKLGNSFPSAMMARGRFHACQYSLCQAMLAGLASGPNLALGKKKLSPRWPGAICVMTERTIRTFIRLTALVNFGKSRSFMRQTISNIRQKKLKNRL